MREENAIFGGEHSGHFYFRDNWYADSGLIAFLIVLELVSVSGKTVSQLLAADRHALPQRRDQQRRSPISRGAWRPSRHTTAREGAQIDHLDGVTIGFPTWWANVRPSNTEPLLRLNVEADTQRRNGAPSRRGVWR